MDVEIIADELAVGFRVQQGGPDDARPAVVERRHGIIHMGNVVELALFHAVHDLFICRAAVADGDDDMMIGALFQERLVL